MEEIKFYIAHNNADIVNFGQASKNSVISTGQPYLEEFESEEEFSKRLGELKNNPDFYYEYLESIKEVDPEEELRIKKEEEIKQIELELENIVKKDHYEHKKIKTQYKRN